MNIYKNLKKVKNYAKLKDCSPAYIYKLISKKDITPVIIDGVIFIDVTKVK